jgi:hypothetical protein
MSDYTVNTIAGITIILGTGVCGCLMFLGRYRATSSQGLDKDTVIFFVKLSAAFTAVGIAILLFSRYM